jgi:hypothetical protein
VRTTHFAHGELVASLLAVDAANAVGMEALALTVEAEEAVGFVTSVFMSARIRDYSVLLIVLDNLQLTVGELQ